MRRQLIEDAAFEVATQCRTAEDSIDTALSELAELQGRIMRARAVMPVGFATGQGAIEKMVQTAQALVSARAAMADCHAALAVARDETPGLRTVSWGNGEECPPPNGRTADLRIVA